jgi:DNA-binding NarL/FixJ family response regulator
LKIIIPAQNTDFSRCSCLAKISIFTFVSTFLSKPFIFASQMKATPHIIAIIEDDNDYRAFLRKITEETGKYTCFGTFANGEAFLEAVRKADKDMHPTLALMDIGLPRMSGVECTRRFVEMCPKAHVMMLTSFDDIENIYQAIIAGASAYHLKTPQKKKILEALEDLYSGGALMTGQIARKAIATFRALAAHVPSQTITVANERINTCSEETLYRNNFDRQEEILRVVSEREYEVLRLLARGDSYKKIAEELFISTSTVKTHIANIYEKLHVNSRGEATAKFLRQTGNGVFSITKEQ